MSQLFACVICGEGLDPMSKGSWPAVTGFAPPRRGGGQNYVALRRVVPGKFAHANCVDLARRGISREQGGLFG